MKLLSILIPTIPERHDRFTKLYNELMRQKTQFDSFHDTLGEVEIIVDASPKFLAGGLSIGKKREALVKRAEGKYLCFLDDDDSISPEYIESLMRMCTEGKDLCTFRAMVKMNNLWALISMSINHKQNEQITPDQTVKRPPWHMCPMRSLYAKTFQFQDINNAEDFEWMEKVLRCCETEIHSEKILYQYTHGEHSEADKIPLP